MNIVAILQARVSSTRLPNKVLKPIMGKPMLQRQIERLLHCKNFNTLVVATSNQADDQPIINLCKMLNISYWAGNLNNVLDRYYQAAKQNNADIIVRLTGDCPLADAEVIDAVIQQHVAENNDYTSNVEQATFPDGLDVEVFNFQQLENAWLYAKKTSELEHVTPYIRQQKHIKKGHYLSAVDYSHYRWTVDEPKDFELVEKIYQKLGNKDTYFASETIYQLLKKHPDLCLINSGITRNEGYIKSLNADKQEQ